MSRARLIFVPGLNPKPPPDLYRSALLRVMLASLSRTRPAAARWLAAHSDCFVLVAWTYLFYGAHRDISVDLPGIERLLLQAEPTAEDLRELTSWSRRITRLAHRIGDAVPWLGRRLAQPTTRLLMHEATRYLKNRDGVGEQVRAKLREALDAAWSDGAEVLLVGHSLGSVIAYDTLWELTRERGRDPCVSLFVTLGSPLGTHFVQRSLKGSHERGLGRYPANVRRWSNFTANGDTTALEPRLQPLFHEIVALGLVEALEDHVGFHNFFRGPAGLNAHDAYGYFAQRVVADTLGEWLERRALV